jgi:quercetin dioxygenase-like cupin family protein
MSERPKRRPVVRRFDGNFGWEAVERQGYKTDRSLFRDVTRQVLFDGEHGASAQLRYFEVGPGGHTTLERHEHPHAVVVLRGRGRVLVGREITEVEPYDLVSVPPMTWHQLRADDDQPLGFLCLVDRERDRPRLPGDEDLAELREDPAVAAFIRC